MNSDNNQDKQEPLKEINKDDDKKKKRYASSNNNI